VIRKKGNLIISVLSLLIILCFTSTAFSLKDTTIIGIVTEDSQLLTDEGDVYDISINEQADKLVKNINMKVEIKGTIETDEDTGAKYIKVSSFKLIKE
jgi:hypothetical protein